jgi:hypothetical protein
MTVRLCEIASEALGRTAADPQMLAIIAADHARDLPGVKVKRGSFELESWRDAALDLLNKHEPIDREHRERAAERLKGKSEREQLFGVPELPTLVVVPKAAARDAEGGGGE